MIKKIKGILPSGIKKTIKLFWHHGDVYQCPFCNYSSRDLEIIGLEKQVFKDRYVIGAGRRTGGCFKCGSTDRERLIYIYLKDIIHIFDSESRLNILHIAPESNLSKRILESGNCDYVCGDLFTEGYDYPEYVKNINLLDIPYKDNTFDLIICNHVLEHIPTDLVAMKELFRVMKKGGQAILQVPISKNSEKTYEDFSITDSIDRENAFGQFDHIRIYGQDYPARLESIGFNVNRVNISQKFMRYGLNKEEDIFVCKN